MFNKKIRLDVRKCIGCGRTEWGVRQDHWTQPSRSRAVGRTMPNFRIDLELEQPSLWVVCVF